MGPSRVTAARNIIQSATGWLWWKSHCFFLLLLMMRFLDVRDTRTPTTISTTKGPSISAAVLARRANKCSAFTCPSPATLQALLSTAHFSAEPAADASAWQNTDHVHNSLHELKKCIFVFLFSFLTFVTFLTLS